MAAFRYDRYQNPYVGSIADLMQRPGDIEARRALQVGDAQARAGEQSGNAWAGAAQQIGQTVAAIPGQIAQQKRLGQEDDARALRLGEDKRAIAARDAFAKIIRETPQLDEDGVSLYDVPAVAKQLAAIGQDPGAAVEHLGKVNDAFRQEKAAKLALVKTGAASVAAAGNDPSLASHFLDQLEKNGTYPKEQVAQFRDFIDADPANVEKLTAYLMGPQKMERGAPGSVAVHPVTGMPVPGSEIAPTPQRPVVVPAGSIAVGPTGATVATGPPKEPTPKSYQKSSVLLDGKPTEILLDPTPGGKIYDLSGAPIDNAAARVRPIPPASVQVYNAQTAEGKGDVSPLAKSIAEYRVPAPSPRSMTAGAGKALMEQVLRENPDYDAGQFPARSKMRIQFTSGPQSQTINSLNTAIGHLDQFTGVVKALDNGNFQPGNQAYNWLKTTFGDSAPTNFAGIRDIMSGELAAAFKKSGATDEEIASVKSSIASKNSTNQLLDYVQTIALPALGSKVVNFDQQYRQVMGAKDPFKILLPESEDILKKYGIDPAHPQMGGKPSTAAPPKNPFRK